MEAGRRPKPTYLKLLADNPGHRPLNDAEPRPEVKIPDAPEWLNGRARAAWDKYADLLVKNKVLTELDGIAFAALCQCFARWAEAEGYIEKQGLVLLSPTGFPIPNPYLSVANRAMEQIRSFLIEFGMTPSSRSKVRVAWSGANDDGSQGGFDF